MTGGQGVCLLCWIGSCSVDYLPVRGVPLPGVARWREQVPVAPLVERSLCPAVGLLLPDGTCRICVLMPILRSFFYAPGSVLRVALSRFALWMVDGLVISGVSLGPYPELLAIGYRPCSDPQRLCPGPYLPCLHWGPDLARR